MTISSITLPDQPPDLLSESSEKLAIVVFSKSSSKNFPIALSIARQATLRQSSVDGRPIYVAYFDKTERGAKLAVSLLEYVGAWKGVIIYSCGRLIKSWYEFTDVLVCYLESCLCNDYRAHCFKMIDDPAYRPGESPGLSVPILSGLMSIKRVEVDRYTFPCVKIYQSMTFQTDHPASYQDQIQALGVKRLCHSCPNFDPAQFKKTGTIFYDEPEY